MPLPVFTATGGKLQMDNVPIHLKGVSWFGAEGDGCVPDGLWSRPMAEYLDFVAANGLNAVRVPVAVNHVLNNPPVRANFVTREPALKQAHCLDALDRLAVLAAERGLLILLDLHRIESNVWPTKHGLWYDPDASGEGSSRHEQEKKVLQRGTS